MNDMNKTRSAKMQRIFDAISQGNFEFSKEQEDIITVSNKLQLKRVAGGRDHHADFAVWDEVSIKWFYNVFTEEEVKQIQNAFYLNSQRIAKQEKESVFDRIDF